MKSLFTIIFAVFIATSVSAAWLNEGGNPCGGSSSGTKIQAGDTCAWAITTPETTTQLSILCPVFYVLSDTANSITPLVGQHANFHTPAAATFTAADDWAEYSTWQYFKATITAGTSGNIFVSCRRG